MLPIFAATFIVGIHSAEAGCATDHYFNEVQTGMTVKRVHYIMSNWGHVIFDDWGIDGHHQTRSYPSCYGLVNNGHPYYLVGYHGSPLKVDSKEKHS
jgi:hypothetical protein